MAVEPLFDLAVIIFMAKMFGEFAQRAGLPSVFGEIVGGLVIGPNIYGYFGAGITSTPFLEEIANVALVILLFRIGLDVNMRKLVEYGRKAVIISLTGVILTFFIGYLWGWTGIGIPAGDMRRNIVLGVILTASSIGISARILADLETIDMPEATLIIESAVVDDVLALLVFSLIVSWLASGTTSVIGLLPVVFRILIFLFGSIWIGRLVVPVLMVATLDMVTRESALLIGLSLAFFMGVLAEMAGLAAIAGALIAGILLAESPRADRIRERIEPVYNFFVPIFFVMLGIEVDLSNLGSILVGGLVITVIAVVSKIVGCGLGAMLSGMSSMSALRIGVGMVPRAEVPLVIASIALRLSPPVISREIFSITVMMTITTSLVAAVLLKWVFEPQDTSPPHWG